MPFNKQTSICLVLFSLRCVAGAALPQISEGALAFADESAPNAPVVVSSDDISFGVIDPVVDDGEIEALKIAQLQADQVTNGITFGAIGLAEDGELSALELAEALELQAGQAAPVPSNETEVSTVETQLETTPVVTETVYEVPEDQSEIKPELINCVIIGFSDENIPIKMCLGPQPEGNLTANEFATLTEGNLVQNITLTPRPITGDICNSQDPLAILSQRPEYSTFLESFMDSIKNQTLVYPTGNEQLMDFIGTSCSLFNQTALLNGTNPYPDFDTSLKVSKSNCFTTEGWIEEYLGNDVETIYFSNSTSPFNTTSAFNTTMAVSNTTDLSSPSIRQTQKGYFKRIVYTKLDLCLEEEFEAVTGKLSVLDIDELETLPCGRCSRNRNYDCSCDANYNGTVTNILTATSFDGYNTATVTDDTFTTVTDDEGEVVTVTATDDGVVFVTVDGTVTPTGTANVTDVNTATVTDGTVVTVTDIDGSVTTRTRAPSRTVTVTAATATSTADSLTIQPGDFVFNQVASSNDDDDEVVEKVIVDDQEIDVYFSQNGTSLIPVATSTVEPSAIGTATIDISSSVGASTTGTSSVEASSTESSVTSEDVSATSTGSSVTSEAASVTSTDASVTSEVSSATSASDASVTSEVSSATSASDASVTSEASSTGVSDVSATSAEASTTASDVSDVSDVSATSVEAATTDVDASATSIEATTTADVSSATATVDEVVEDDEVDVFVTVTATDADSIAVATATASDIVDVVETTAVEAVVTETDAAVTETDAFVTETDATVVTETDAAVVTETDDAVAIQTAPAQAASGFQTITTPAATATAEALIAEPEVLIEEFDLPVTEPEVRFEDVEEQIVQDVEAEIAQAVDDDALVGEETVYAEQPEPIDEAVVAADVIASEVVDEAENVAQAFEEVVDEAENVAQASEEVPVVEEVEAPVQEQELFAEQKGWFDQYWF